jgi:ABC-type Na+ efflux pump permease subunit
MQQINLFETMEERLRRTEEIRHPVLLFHRNASHVGKLLSLAAGLCVVELSAIRLSYGTHDPGEETVVVATPLMLSYLAFRLIRTRIQPTPRQEISSARKLRLSEWLGILFALGAALLALFGLSSLIYTYFGVHWAEEASRAWIERGFVVMTLLGIAMFLTSDQGRRNIRKLVGLALAIPGLARSHFEATLPTGRTSHYTFGQYPVSSSSFTLHA